MFFLLDAGQIASTCVCFYWSVDANARYAHMPNGTRQAEQAVFLRPGVFLFFFLMDSQEPEPRSLNPQRAFSSWLPQETQESEEGS